MSGILYIVPTPIGNLEDITLRAIRILKEVDLVLCEDTSVTQRLFKDYDITTKTSAFYAQTGLKNIEKALGIKRGNIVGKFHGGDALALWRMYRATGDEYYLNLLVEYNEYDLINLKIVAEHCVKKLKEKMYAY